MQKQVTLNPGQNQRVYFLVSPAAEGNYTVKLNGLAGGFVVRPPEGLWVLPTGHNDPQNDWSKYPHWPPEAAYDGDEETFATADVEYGPSWTGWLELIHSELLCSKVRWLQVPSNYTSSMQVEANWGGVWHPVFEGNPHSHAYMWTEVELGGTYLVSALRFRFWRSRDDKLATADVYEVNFWG